MFDHSSSDLSTTLSSAVSQLISLESKIVKSTRHPNPTHSYPSQQQSLKEWYQSQSLNILPPNYHRPNTHDLACSTFNLISQPYLSRQPSQSLPLSQLEITRIHKEEEIHERFITQMRQKTNSGEIDMNYFTELEEDRLIKMVFMGKEAKGGFGMERFGDSEGRVKEELDFAEILNGEELGLVYKRDWLLLGEKIQKDILDVVIRTKNQIQRYETKQENVKESPNHTSPYFSGLEELSETNNSLDQQLLQLMDSFETSISNYHELQQKNMELEEKSEMEKQQILDLENKCNQLQRLRSTNVDPAQPPPSSQDTSNIHPFIQQIRDQLPLSTHFSHLQSHLTHLQLTREKVKQQTRILNQELQIYQRRAKVARSMGGFVNQGENIYLELEEKYSQMDSYKRIHEGIEGLMVKAHRAMTRDVEEYVGLEGWRRGPNDRAKEERLGRELEGLRRRYETVVKRFGEQDGKNQKAGIDIREKNVPKELSQSQQDPSFHIRQEQITSLSNPLDYTSLDPHPY